MACSSGASGGSMLNASAWRPSATGSGRRSPGADERPGGVDRRRLFCSAMQTSREYLRSVCSRASPESHESWLPEAAESDAPHPTNHCRLALCVLWAASCFTRAKAKAKILGE